MVRWYVLQVSTGQETAVREALEGLGVRAAVPREERLIRSGRGLDNEGLHAAAPAMCSWRWSTAPRTTTG